LKHLKKHRAVYIIACSAGVAAQSWEKFAMLWQDICWKSLRCRPCSLAGTHFSVTSGGVAWWLSGRALDLRL